MQVERSTDQEKQSKEQHSGRREQAPGSREQGAGHHLSSAGTDNFLESPLPKTKAEANLRDTGGQ